MDAAQNLETRLGTSLDDLIKQQQQAKKKGERQGASKVKKAKSKTGGTSAPKVLKATGGVMKAVKTGRRLGGRKAPLKVATAVTKTKTKQTGQAKTTTTKSKSSVANIELRTKADAMAAVKAMQPLMEKAKKILNQPAGGNKKAVTAKSKGRRVNTDVVMKGQGGGGGRRSRSGNRRN